MNTKKTLNHCQKHNVSFLSVSHSTGVGGNKELRRFSVCPVIVSAAEDWLHWYSAADSGDLASHLSHCVSLCLCVCMCDCLILGTQGFAPAGEQPWTWPW